MAWSHISLPAETRSESGELRSAGGEGTRGKGKGCSVPTLKKRNLCLSRRIHQSRFLATPTATLMTGKIGETYASISDEEASKDTTPSQVRQWTWTSNCFYQSSRMGRSLIGSERSSMYAGVRCWLLISSCNQTNAFPGTDLSCQQNGPQGSWQYRS